MIASKPGTRARLAAGVAEDLGELECPVEETLPRRDVSGLGDERRGHVRGKAATSEDLVGERAERNAARFRRRSPNHALHHRSQTSFHRSTGASLRVNVANACSLARTCSSVSPGSVAMRDLTAIASTKHDVLRVVFKER